MEDPGAERLERLDQLYVEDRCETDRRAIDDLLGRRIILAHAQASLIHRGVNHYAARDLAGATMFAALELARPQ